jgi:hypothetical protein
MVRRHVGWVVGVVVLLLAGAAWLSSGIVFAQAAKGAAAAPTVLGPKQEAWQKEEPPGWKQWSDKQKDEWGKAVDHARNSIRAHEKAREEAALRGMEIAARKGVPVTDAQEMARMALDGGLDPADYDALAQSTANSAKQGLRGNDLAAAVQREIQRLNDARTRPTVLKKEEKATGKVEKAEAAQEQAKEKK